MVDRPELLEHIAVVARVELDGKHYAFAGTGGQRAAGGIPHSAQSTAVGCECGKACTIDRQCHTRAKSAANRAAVGDVGERRIEVLVDVVVVADCIANGENVVGVVENCTVGDVEVTRGTQRHRLKAGVGIGDAGQCCNQRFTTLNLSVINSCQGEGGLTGASDRDAAWQRCRDIHSVRHTAPAKCYVDTLASSEGNRVTGAILQAHCVGERAALSHARRIDRDLCVDGVWCCWHRFIRDRAVRHIVATHGDCFVTAIGIGDRGDRRD